MARQTKIATWLLIATIGVVLSLWQANPETDDENPTLNSDNVTFNRDVAPILFEHCVFCHRPGESAPFSLISYVDAAQRASQITEVTGSGYMPPWQPESGHGTFVGERRLSDRQVATIQRWLQDGVAEGDVSDLPPLPKWTPGWQLGQPDVVVEMEESYTLSPHGRDVYRQFVLPLRLNETRYVRAIELRPGNKKILHHAIVKLDRTGVARRADQLDPEPGYAGGMFTETLQGPSGHFLVWTPGMTPSQGDSSIGWRLDPGMDIVLECHMSPSGKPEPIQVAVGLFFTDEIPGHVSSVLRLEEVDIEIPAGKDDYLIEDQYVLPVDVDVLSVFPHAHYLCRDMKGLATLPDGTTRWLIRIKDWDFDWQNKYVFATPVQLPQGTRLTMEFTYDNSAANPRNPHQPPKRVDFGWQSTDEMGNLTYEVLTKNDNDLLLLSESLLARPLQQNPNDWRTIHQVGRLFVRHKKYGQAASQFQRALKIKPDFALAHYDFGRLLQMDDRLDQAASHFQYALRIEPNDASVHYDFGRLLALQTKLDDAVFHFKHALRIKPDDAPSHFELGVVLARQNRFKVAVDHFRQGLRIQPNYAVGHYNLGLVLSPEGKIAEAISAYKEAVRLQKDLSPAYQHLAWLQATHPDASFRDGKQAVINATKACELSGWNNYAVLDTLAAAYAESAAYDAAVKWQSKAVELAPKDVRKMLGKRLNLYRTGRPFRQSPDRS